MAYQKIGFKNGNVLTAEQLIHMEDGIINAEKKAGAGTPGAGTPGGTGTGLPSDVGAYKYMATDGEGNWVAEDRLAWKTESEKEIFAETIINVADADGMGIYPFGAGLGLVIGKTYTVSFDGTLYECVAAHFGNTVVLGNLAIVGEGENTEEPFFIDDRSGGAVLVTGSIGEHTLHIIQNNKTVKTVPVDLLPKGIGWSEDGRIEIANLNVTVLHREEHGMYTNGGDTVSPFGFFAGGEKYTVVLDGVEYSDLYANGSGDGAFVGAYADLFGTNEMTAELPFSIATRMVYTETGEFISLTFCTILDGTEHNVQIYKNGEVIHPIPAEYIPRIVFTYDGTNYTCNVPFADFEDAVESGLPMSYVDKSDGLWVCINIIVNKVDSGFEIFVYRSSGTEDIVLEYTSSGLNEVVDEV